MLLTLERVVLPILLLCSVLLNLYQVRVVRALRDRPVTSAPVLSPGTQLDSIQLRDGNELSLASNNGRGTVLYVFSPQCVWSSRNSAGLRKLHSATSEAYTYIGLSVEAAGLDEWLKEHKPPFPHYVTSSRAEANRVGLGVTPQTILLDEHGRVVASWNGAFVGTVAAQLEKYFNFSLDASSSATE